MFSSDTPISVKSGFDVVMVTTAHPALDDRIFHREAKTLLEAGFSVAVLGRHPRSEFVDGIAIETVPKMAGSSQSSSRLARLLLFWPVLRTSLKLRGRLYVFHDPELFLLGIVLRLLGKKVAYDCHENLPMQVLQKYWLPAPARWLLVPLSYAAEWVGSRMLNGVILARPAIAARFPKHRTIIVRNFPTAAALRMLAAGPPIERRSNLVIYSGGLSRIRGIKELVTAFCGLANARLLLVGEFDTAEFQQEILDLLPENADWIGFKPHEEVLQLYSSAKLGVVLLYPTPNHRDSLPVKVFEYLGAGLPIIASNLPEFAEYVEGCGIQVNPHDIGEIRRGIDFLLSDDVALAHMSRIARGRALNQFNWQAEGSRLVDFCSKVVGKPKRLSTAGREIISTRAEVSRPQAS